MKPENRKFYLDKSKTDCHVHEDGKKILNWWEDEITLGIGTIKTKIQDEIDDGVDEYFEEEKDEKAKNGL